MVERRGERKSKKKPAAVTESKKPRKLDFAEQYVRKRGKRKRQAAVSLDNELHSGDRLSVGVI